MSKQTAKRDEKPLDPEGAFWAGVFISLLVAGLCYLVVRDSDDELYQRAYSDAVRVTTTCTKAMERVHEVCGSDKPSEPVIPPLFAPVPIPN